MIFKIPSNLSHPLIPCRRGFGALLQREVPHFVALPEHFLQALTHTQLLC